MRGKRYAYYGRGLDGLMAGCDYSCLLNGGDCMGMTDSQYRGMLVDQLRDWKEVLEMAMESGDTRVQKKAEEMIEVINEKLKL